MATIIYDCFISLKLKCIERGKHNKGKVAKTFLYKMKISKIRRELKSEVCVQASPFFPKGETYVSNHRRLWSNNVACMGRFLY